eukprot:11563-Chlamydomonas_euryale.AAC.5
MRACTERVCARDVARLRNAPFSSSPPPRASRPFPNASASRRAPRQSAVSGQKECLTGAAPERETAIQARARVRARALAFVRPKHRRILCPRGCPCARLGLRRPHGAASTRSRRIYPSKGGRRVRRRVPVRAAVVPPNFHRLGLSRNATAAARGGGLRTTVVRSESDKLLIAQPGSPQEIYGAPDIARYQPAPPPFPPAARAAAAAITARWRPHTTLSHRTE